MRSVSILVLTKNGAEYIGALLEGVYSQKQATANEVILVDSGSADSTLEIAARFPARIAHIPANSFHHARTRNYAASLASGEILVFLSQDAIPATDTWLASLLSNFTDGKVGAVYGRQIPHAGSSIERKHVLETLYGEQRVVKDPALGNHLGYRFYHFSDVNAALRRSVWQTTGFPEDLKVFEDLGIAKRILDAGWKIVYEPQAPVFHSHEHSTFGLFRRYFDIGYTLKYLQIWNAKSVGSSVIRDGTKMLRKTFRRSSYHRRDSISGTIGQDIAKSLGLFLGLKQQYLPLMLKKHLTAHGVYSK